MAIYQFGINFIPVNKIGEQFQIIHSNLDGNLLHELDLDKGVKLPGDFVSFLNSLATEKEHWCKEARIWGENSGNHIDVWNWSDPEKTEVYSRLHVGDWQREFVEKILEFAKMCECLLFTKNKTIIEPKMELLVEEVKKSNSYRFCENPIDYLQSDEVKKINQEWQEKLGGKESPVIFTESVENVSTKIIEKMKKKLSE